MLIDSDVLVWLTRGHLGAAWRLQEVDPWRISVVTARQAEVLRVTPAISQRVAELIDTLTLSHGMRLADALIGATAIEHGLTLLTANVKHFGPVGSLQIEAFLP